MVTPNGSIGATVANAASGTDCPARTPVPGNKPGIWPPCEELFGSCVRKMYVKFTQEIKTSANILQIIFFKNEVSLAGNSHRMRILTASEDADALVVASASLLSFES